MTIHSATADHLVPILDLIRFGRANTRPEIARLTGLGRTVVTQRVADLIDAGLVLDASMAESTGGRPSRALAFNARLGALLVAELGATAVNAAVTNLAGDIMERRHEDIDIADGPDVVLGIVEAIFDELVTAHPRLEVWGIGVGLPGPVEFSNGSPTSPPIMPGWDRYPVRVRLSSRYHAPTWIDNDVNLLALGELRRGIAIDVDDAIFVKIGTGIGAGLISEGRLHRGAQGAAGDIGHVRVTETTAEICRCGKVGCLEAVAGGQAIARQGLAAAQSGSSPFLADLLATGASITSRDVSNAAARGDLVANEILSASGRLVGQTIAAMVNFFNPSLVIIGGGVANAGDRFLASIRQSIYERSLPLATRDLRVPRSELGDVAGIYGAAALVSDEILSRDLLPHWIELGRTAGLPELPLLASSGPGRGDR
ncbi:MAG: ROK family protein [Actinomycetota bacterium]|nr:ROK family protein [Actinomycetota bacterium]